MNYYLGYDREARCLACGFAEESCIIVQVFIGITYENSFWVTIHSSDKLAYN